MTLFERIAAARATGDVDAFVKAIPYSRFLGLGARVRPEDGDVIVTMTFGPQLVGNPSLPALHGGTLGALLESAAIFQLLWASESVLLPKTITITIDYLRSAKAIDTHARGVVTRLGRRVATVRCEAWQDDPSVIVAAANAHFLIKRDE